MPSKLIRITILLAFLLIHGQARAVDTATFTGLVVDLDKRPVAKAEIFLYTTDNIRRPADFISAATDASGRFTMILPAGRYWAVARVRKGDKFGPLLPGDKHSGEPLFFDISPAQTVTETFTVVDLAESARLNKKTSLDFFRVRGRIVDGRGQALTPAYAIANQSDLSPPIAEFISAWTDGDGRYLLYLPAGRFHLGYARTFPAEKTGHHVRIITVQSHMEDIDIVVNDPTIQNGPAAPANAEQTDRLKDDD